MNTSLESYIKTLLFTSKTKFIDWKEYDWNENIKDEDLADHPMIARNKKFYQNPMFWATIFDLRDFGFNVHGYSEKTIRQLEDILLDSSNDLVDTDILCMLLIKNIYTNVQLHKILNSKGVESFELNQLLLTVAGTEKNNKYYDILKKYEYKDEDGSVFVEACRNYKVDMIDNLLEKDQEEVTKSNSMGFLLLVKHGNYTKALELLDKGADIHALHDLGYKAFLKNDSNRFCPKGEEAAHNEIMNRFKTNECLKEVLSQKKETIEEE